MNDKYIFNSIIKKLHSPQAVTWVVDATQLRNIKYVSWIGNNEGDAIVIGNENESLNIMLKNTDTGKINNDLIIVICIYNGKKQFATLKRNEPTQWSDRGDDIPITQQDLEKALQSSEKHLEHINYVKVTNYTHGPYSGSAWYDVKNKRYLYTSDQNSNLTKDAIILGSNNECACFFVLHEKKVDLDKIKLNPLFWITKAKEGNTIKKHIPMLNRKNNNKNLMFKFTILSGAHGLVFQEKYFLSSDNTNNNPPVISIGYTVTSSNIAADEFYSWELSTIDNLAPSLYQKIKSAKKDASNVNMIAFFYLTLELAFLSDTIIPYVFSDDASSRIRLTEKVRLSFTDDNVLWYLRERGEFIEGVVDNVTGQQMIPIWLYGGKESNHGYWIVDNIPANGSGTNGSNFPELKIFYQNSTGTGGKFIENINSVKGFSQKAGVLFLSTYEGVVYFLDQYGNSFVYAFEKGFFKKNKILTQLDNTLCNQQIMPFIRIRGLFWHNGQEERREITVYYCTENKHFYLIDKDAEKYISDCAVNDSNQLLVFDATSKKIRVYRGMSIDEFEAKLLVHSNGVLYFDRAVDYYLETGLVIDDVDDVKHIKDGFIIKISTGILNLSFKIDNGKYIFTLLSINVEKFDASIVNKIENKIKFLRDMLNSFDDTSIFHSEIMVPKIIQIIRNGKINGWYYSDLKRIFILRYNMIANNTALLLGFNSQKDYLYACIDGNKIVRIKKQEGNSLKDIILEASSIVIANDQLLITPLDNKPLTFYSLMSISPIDNINTIIIQPSTAKEKIYSDEWGDINIAINITGVNITQVSDIIVNLTRIFSISSYIQRRGRNLWLYQYGCQYGFCLFNCFDGDVVLDNKGPCYFISEINPDKKISQQDLIAYYSSKINNNASSTNPKIPLEPYLTIRCMTTCG